MKQWITTLFRVFSCILCAEVYVLIVDEMYNQKAMLIDVVLLGLISYIILFKE
jgi:hypothetical protein